MDNPADSMPTSSDNLPAVVTRAPRRQWPLWLFLLMLIALMAWQWIDGRARLEDVRIDFAKRLAANDALLHDSRELAKQNQELVANLQARVVSVESDFAAAQSQQVALESMYQEMSRSRDERVLAEVEQSITIAAQQLQLAGNVEAALIALNGADTRLARTAQPQFLPLRKLIARDIANLTAMPVADITGMAVKIESIVAQVDGFPMAFEQRPRTEPSKNESTTAAKKSANKVMSNTVANQKTSGSELGNTTNQPWWQTWLGDIWSETRRLIRIERIDHADAGLLPPTQVYFLRENIKLRLVNARLALLARDGRSFREDTRQVAEWLDRYFDTHAAPVQASIATMKALSALDIVQQTPSLNETLTTVRNFKLGRKQ